MNIADVIERLLELGIRVRSQISGTWFTVSIDTGYLLVEQTGEDEFSIEEHDWNARGHSTMTQLSGETVVNYINQ